MSCADARTASNAEVAAWDRYTAIARRVTDDTALLTDRAHCEELALAWSNWRDLFLMAAR